MLNRLIDKLYDLTLEERLLSIHIASLSALALITSRYLYIYFAYDVISPLIFVAIAISGLAVFLLLIRFYLLLQNFNPQKFVDNSDWLTASLIGLGYVSVFLAKYSLGDTFAKEALPLSFMIVIISGQLNRFSPVIAVPIMWVTSALYGLGIPPLEHLFVSTFVFMQQITIWAFGLGVMMEIRSHDKSQHLAASLKTTQDLLEHSTKQNERMRVGREIHDTMGHNLAALNINLQVCEKTAPESMQEIIKQCRSSVEALYQELQDTVHDLKHVDNFSLVESLKNLISNTPRLNIEFECTQDNFEFSDEQANCILRIVQEGITNTLKHSDSNDMKVQLGLKNDDDASSPTIFLDIEDGGKLMYFNKKLILSNGMQGMSERIHALGGTIAFNSQEKPGFHINATLPLNHHD